MEKLTAVFNPEEERLKKGFRAVIQGHVDETDGKLAGDPDSKAEARELLDPIILAFFEVGILQGLNLNDFQAEINRGVAQSRLASLLWGQRFMVADAYRRHAFMIADRRFPFVLPTFG